MAAAPGPAGTPFVNFIGVDENNNHFELEWHWDWNRPVKRSRGITGWARTVRTTNPAVANVGSVRRFHQCAHTPCTSKWSSGSYQVFGPPLHVRVAESFPDVPPPAAHEPPPAESAVAEPAQEQPVVGPAPPVSDDAPSPEDVPAPEDAPPASEDAPPASEHAEDGAVPTAPPPPPAATLSPVPAAPPTGAQPAPAACSPSADAPNGAPVHGVDAASAIPAAAVDLTALTAAPDPAAVAARTNVLRKLMNVAREIQQTRAYVGYSFFALVALCRKCRPCMWEGESRVSIIDTFAPWAHEHGLAAVAVDGVCCCPGDGGWAPVSKDYPLHRCRHFVAGVAIAPENIDGDTFSHFYRRLGIAIVPTIADGDCGVDTACLMLGIPQTVKHRERLREEVSRYLMDRVEEYWMQDLMVALQELTSEEVAAARSCGGPAGGEAARRLAPQNVAEPVGDERSTEAEVDPERAIEVLKWATNCSESAVLENLRLQMPIAVLREQMQLYDARSKTALAVKKIACNPFYLKNREAVCKALDAHLKTIGIDRPGEKGRRLPKHVMKSFLADSVVFTGRPLKTPSRDVRRWYDLWVKNGTPDHSQQPSTHSKRHSHSAVVPFKKRARAMGAGAHTACPVIREQLFEWWQGIRYSVDWKALAEVNRSRGRKCLARFPRSVIKAKLRELMEAYCAECLIHGVGAKVFQVTSRWFINWQNEYGLSLRAPNRKYKVPRAVLDERMRLWWTSVFRVRALCLAVFGYDPEQENWDQSPFHNNESGCQNVGTLSFKGAPTVPLVEGHADTRKRWSGNFVTWSNKDRIVKEGPPYAEYCFKADGEQLVLQLREHIRSRGYGSWLTVATSPKGSYREADILNFLDIHLPKMEEGRRWRIIMADDYAAHHADNVWRLCWSRGYVLILHGGGATPVAQTVDTDLNQHVKRDYIAQETRELINQFRDTAVAVPRIKETMAIDMMTSVLSRTQLHLDAAEGYKKTGATVDIDGLEDDKIVREAGKMWKDMGMRQIIDREVKHVRQEAAAGRLTWTARSVRKLLCEYPAHRKVDAVLAKQGDDTSVPEGEDPHAEEDVEENDDDSEKSDAAVAEEPRGDDDDDEEQTEEEEDVEAAPTKEQEVAEEHGQKCAAVVTKSVDISEISITEAQELEKSQTLIDAFEQAIGTLRQCGALNACTALQNEIRKERRRQRNMSEGNTAVAVALVRRRECEAQEARRRKQLEMDATKQMLKKKADAQKEAAQAKELIQKRKLEIAQLENALSTKRELKRFAPESLGQGNAKGGGAVARKLRYEVLDRVSRVGAGISPGQKNDWAWFKQAWDQRMLEEHGSDWGGTFASWMQQVVDDASSDKPNALSVFVYTETRRCFGDQPALRV